MPPGETKTKCKLGKKKQGKNKSTYKLKTNLGLFTINNNIIVIIRICKMGLLIFCIGP